jgi:hypothetical protein
MNGHLMGHEWASVATFDEAQEARKLLLFLRIWGFESQIDDEHRLQQLWFAVKPRASVHVQVREEAIEDARRCLQTTPEARAVFARAVHCPSCGSSRVQYPAMTRKNLFPTLVAHILVLLRLQKREFFCEDCHFTWA